MVIKHEQTTAKISFILINEVKNFDNLNCLFIQNYEKFEMIAISLLGFSYLQLSVDQLLYTTCNKLFGRLIALFRKKFHWSSTEKGYRTLLKLFRSMGFNN